jgi:hypothetical protein
MLKLLEHDYSVEYKKGLANRAADALSRQFSAVNTISVVQPTWLQNIADSYASDPVTAALVQQFAVTPPPPTSPHTFHQGILRYKGRIMIGSNESLQAKIFSALHCSAIGGHALRDACDISTHQKALSLAWTQTMGGKTSFNLPCVSTLQT